LSERAERERARSGEEEKEKRNGSISI